ncbi:MAG: hypothetical protein DLM71_07675 [Chloroflexi bacterium]|nr:MAG: hypothetical protein DLM71_07675 [Chloroflexota bacterium]
MNSASRLSVFGSTASGLTRSGLTRSGLTLTRWRTVVTLAASLVLVAASTSSAVGGSLGATQATGAGASRGAVANDGARGRLDHVFVIMLENHSRSSVIGDRNAPFITSLARTYGMAANYYGVTHPSLPNYVGAISGSNWFVNDDNPANRFDHRNLIDQLEERGKSWAAYMETMPSASFLGDQYPANAALYVSKHNPFVLFEDIRSNPARLAKIKPYTSLAGDLARGKVADFVWISPNQCHDMHGGVYTTVAGEGVDGAPCPYGSAKDDPNDAALKAKADAFVRTAVNAIMRSRAWTGNSAIFLLTDENDYTGDPTTDGWESAAGCCDSPLLPDGYAFRTSHGTLDGNVWHCAAGPAASCTYGGGLVPAIVIARNGVRHYTSSQPYNHYSLLRTLEAAWGLGYLENASDSRQVKPMTEFLQPGTDRDH